MEKNSDPFYIKVVATTNQKKENFVAISDNRFEIFLKEKAERGEANKKIISLLNNYYKEPKGGITIINGHHSPIKLIRIGR